MQECINTQNAPEADLRDGKTFLIILNEDYSVLGMHYRVTSERTSAAGTPRKNGKIMVRMLCKYAEFLVSKGEENVGARFGLFVSEDDGSQFVTVLEGDEADGFDRDVITKWKKDSLGVGWFQAPFGKSKEAKLPFRHWPRKIAFSTEGEGRIPRVVIRHTGVSLDSADAKPGAFEKFGKLFESAEHLESAEDLNFAQAIGAIVLKGATDFEARLRSEAHTVSHPFSHANKVIQRFINEKNLQSVELYLTSLVRPTDFIGDQSWKNHHENIRDLSKETIGNPDRRKRRLYALSKSLLDDPLELITLADLALYDLQHGLDSRVLALEPGAIDFSQTIPMADGILLMDHGIVSNREEKYGIIVSDIKPVIETAKSSHLHLNFCLYEFPESDEQALYYYLLHNFQKAWCVGTTQSHKIRYLPTLLEQVAAIEVRKVEPTIPVLRYFQLPSPKQGAKAVNWVQSVKAEASRLLRESKVTSRGFPSGELQFTKWFNGHCPLRHVRGANRI